MQPDHNKGSNGVGCQRTFQVSVTSNMLSCRTMYQLTMFAIAYTNPYWHAHSKYAVVLYIAQYWGNIIVYLHLHTHLMSRGNHFYVTCRSICDVLIGKKYDRSLDCSFLRLLIIWFLRVKRQIAALRSWFWSWPQTGHTSDYPLNVYHTMGHMVSVAVSYSSWHKLWPVRLGTELMEVQNN